MDRESELKWVSEGTFKKVDIWSELWECERIVYRMVWERYIKGKILMLLVVGWLDCIACWKLVLALFVHDMGKFCSLMGHSQMMFTENLFHSLLVATLSLRFKGVVKSFGGEWAWFSFRIHHPPLSRAMTLLSSMFNLFNKAATSLTKV